MNTRELWVQVLTRLKPTIQKPNFITWFQSTAVIDVKDSVATIGVPTSFARDWISAKYEIKIIQALSEVDDKIKSVEYEICSRFLEKNCSECVDVKAIYAEEDDKTVRKIRGVNEVKVTKGKNGVPMVSKVISQRYTLDNFIVGRENSLPHAASQAVSHSPGGVYNPLYIYGKVGLGKTHLLQAIGNEVLNRFPDKVVKYITAEKFVTEVVEAIGKRQTHRFKEQYRSVDVFLVDDVQFFARKDSSQQEFFHTFNELYDRNKQIVITSDRSPSELDDLDDRLKSRFGMGMVVELLFPEYEARLAILQQKCKEFQIIMAPDVLQFIAQNVHDSVRELEGVLRQAMAESQLFDRVPTIRSVAEIIKRMNKAQEIIGFDIDAKRDQAFKAKSIEDVMKVVAEFYGISIQDLISEDRHKEIMLPRQICMYLIKNELNQSYERIGMGFGGRNHTTVMNACRKAAKLLKTNLNLVRDVNVIKREMGF